MTHSAFDPHKHRGLDIIQEDSSQRDEEEDDEVRNSPKKKGGKISEQAKNGSKKYVSGEHQPVL